jgi:hypothetical protein
MKQAFYALLVLGLIYFIYWYLTRSPEIVEVQGTLRVLEESNHENVYNASIQGTAKNIGDFTAKKVWIYYKIDKEEVSAYISELAPKQSVIFRTGICQTTIKEPKIELVNILYSR